MKRASFIRVASEAKLFSSDELEEDIVKFVNSIKFQGPNEADEYSITNDKREVSGNLKRLEKKLKQEIKVR